MFRQQRKTHQEVSPKLGVDDGSASGSRAQLVFWSLWPHNVTTFTFLFCPPTSKKVKATLNNFPGLQILSLTFQAEKALDPGTHPDQEDTDYHTG